MNDSTKRPVGQSNLARCIRQPRKQGAYKTTDRTNGRPTQNNGDPVAKALLTVEHAKLVAFVATHFGRRYDHLNPGHQRMCCGNLLRAAVKANDTEAMRFLGLLAA